MNIVIKEETEKDFKLIYETIKEAFLTAEHSDGDEQNLVNRLRNSKSYISELALEALVDERVAGYLMMTKIKIKEKNESYDSLALAPLAIKPEFQGMGIGTTLVEAALENAKKLGYKSVIVLGSEKYYPRFGFKEASGFDVRPPFEVPEENFMVIELEKDSLKYVSGVVEYAKEFFEQ